MIVTTKLHIPRSRHPIVDRPRLTRLLDEAKNAKLTLVSAQAGYGKTTAVGEWVARRDAPTAWLSLDRSDNDWASFWRYVLASVRQHVPDFGASCLPLLEGDAAARPELAIQALLNELNLLDDDITIVLDDYHTIELPAIHESLSDLVSRLPSSVRMCVTSRAELPFPVTRLMATGEFRRVDMNDLKFRPDEGLAFFREATELSLTRDQAVRLVEQTEGWISGLQLAAISLKRSDDIAESVRRLDGRQRLIFDYLLEEVYSRLPESLRDFLLDTSVLPRMNGSLCEAVTGQPNAQDQLEKLEQLNLFIVPLDERRHWYRYHHLLSLFLQQMLKRTSPDRLARAHVRAARWFEQGGFREEAVEHYLAGDAHADAIRVIEENVPAFMQANVSALGRWVSVLPEASWADKPMLTLFSLTALVVGGHWDAAYRRAEQAMARFEALQDRMPPEEWRMAMGNLHFFRGVAAYLRQDFERSSNGFELAERLAPEGSPFQMMGRNRYRGNDSLQDLLTVIRDPQAAEPFFLRWIVAWKHKRRFPFIGFMYAAYCGLLYEWNRLEEAERFIGEAQQREDLLPYARMMADIAVTASRIHRAKGRLDQAWESLRRLESEIDTPDRPLFVRKIQAERASLALSTGMSEPALEWMADSGLSHADEASHDRMAEQLLLSRALASDGRFGEALELLARLDRLAASGAYAREKIRVAIAHAVTLWQAGRRREALPKLAHSLRMAEPQRYVRSFVDEGAAMAEMLAELAKPGGFAEPALRPYIRRLLQALEGEPQGAAADKPSLSAQETKVLSLMADGLANKEIADRLAITVETVKFHVKNAYRKLGANNRVQAVARARQWEILI